MSKKSRKRNKKILAAIGLGLGAMALSKRKSKSDLASTEDGKSGSTKITGGTNSNDYDSGTKKPVSKPDNKMPDNLSKNTGKDNKKPYSMEGKFTTVTTTDDSGKKTTKKLEPFKNSGLTLGVSKRKRNPDTNKGYATKTGNSRGDLGLTGKPEKKDYFGATLFPRGKAADNFKTDNREYGRANTYKSGGRVKGCGKALRGFGKAMKGKR